MKYVEFPEPSALYVQAARKFAQIASEAIDHRGRFLVALAGGETPLPLYRRLPDLSDVDWGRVHVFWSDERCVPPDDPRSNYGAAREALLDRVPIPPEQIHRVPGERAPRESADAYEILLRRELAGDDRLDLILLGIGADGHTASLFPRHQGLEETERLILPVHVSADPAWRVTMTLPAINAARDVIFLAVGREKADVVRRLERGEDLPAGRVRPVDGHLTWLVSSTS